MTGREVGAVAECPECGQDVPLRREPTVGELGLCDGAPADDAMRWTPADNFPEEGQT